MLKTKKNQCASPEKNYHFSILGLNFLSIEDLHKNLVKGWLQKCYTGIFLLSSCITKISCDYSKSHISFINDFVVLSVCTVFFMSN